MTDILLITDQHENSYREITFEMITAASELAEQSGGAVHVGTVGDMDSASETLSVKGVDKIHALEYEGPFNPEVYTQFIAELAKNIDVGPILLPDTANGWDYAPAVAEHLDVPIITDVFDLNFDGTVEAKRKKFESKVISSVSVDDRQAVITVSEHEWDLTEGKSTAEYVTHSPNWLDAPGGPTFRKYQEIKDSDIDITNSEFIVSVGRGIQEEENLSIVRELCDVTGATLAGTRPLVEHGWLPWSRQVGKSGHTVSPQVYIAVGISGAVEHLVGMKSSQVIIAINNDPNAPIFDVADYGIVGDLFEILPEIIDQLS